MKKCRVVFFVIFILIIKNEKLLFTKEQLNDGRLDKKENNKNNYFGYYRTRYMPVDFDIVLDGIVQNSLAQFDYSLFNATYSQSLVYDKNIEITLLPLDNQVDLIKEKELENELIKILEDIRSCRNVKDTFALFARAMKYLENRKEIKRELEKIIVYFRSVNQKIKSDVFDQKQLINSLLKECPLEFAFWSAILEKVYHSPQENVYKKNKEIWKEIFLSFFYTKLLLYKELIIEIGQQRNNLYFFIKIIELYQNFIVNYKKLAIYSDLKNFFLYLYLFKKEIIELKKIIDPKKQAIIIQKILQNINDIFEKNIQKHEK